MEKKERQMDVGTMKRGRIADCMVQWNNLISAACDASWFRSAVLACAVTRSHVWLGGLPAATGLLPPKASQTFLIWDAPGDILMSEGCAELDPPLI